MNTAKNVMGAARDGAEHAFDSAREGAEHAYDTARHGTENAVHGTRSALLDVVHTLGGLIATLRGLDRDDALGWVGLARRRGPLPSIAIFGAGMLMGAGIGVLFAPMSGAQMRSAILGRVKGVKEDVKESIDQVASEVKEVEAKVEKKVENLAGKVGDAVKKTADDVKSASSTAKTHGHGGGATHHQS
jgi:gas vesicle protein